MRSWSNLKSKRNKRYVKFRTLKSLLDSLSSQGHKIVKVNIGQCQSKVVKIVKLMGRWLISAKDGPKMIDDRTTKSEFSYEVKSSGFETRMSNDGRYWAKSMDHLEEKMGSNKAQRRSRGAWYHMKKTRKRWDPMDVPARTFLDLKAKNGSFNSWEAVKRP